MALRSSALKVQRLLKERGFSFTVTEMPESTRTAAEAAQAVGCDVAQIAKSLVFRGKNSGRPVLVIASGANRVDESRLAGLLGEPVGRADAAFVRQATGYAIGGVAPVTDVVHPAEAPLATFLDRDLFSHDSLWAAAGTPHALFCLSPGALKELTGGEVVEIGQAQP